MVKIISANDVVRDDVNDMAVVDCLLRVTKKNPILQKEYEEAIANGDEEAASRASFGIALGNNLREYCEKEIARREIKYEVVE